MEDYSRDKRKNCSSSIFMAFRKSNAKWIFAVHIGTHINTVLVIPKQKSELQLKK